MLQCLFMSSDPTDCGALVDPTNGRVLLSSGTTYGSEARYSCISRMFRLEGPATRSCQLDGQWSATQPQCVQIGRHQECLAFALNPNLFNCL